MQVFKYIVLFAVVVLTIWLIVDTSITIVKKVKSRKNAKKEEDSKTE